MKEGAVDPVDVLAHLLQHQHVAGEIGLSGVPSSWLQDGDVEGGGLRCRTSTVGSSASGERSMSHASARFTAASPPSRMMSSGIGPCATSAKPRA